MHPTISIIVPCYNQALYLPEALSSVMEQEFQDWECIIVDDGSPDNTKDVAQNWVKKDSRFKYFHKPNEGVSAARNYGIKQALGEYIFPLDGDDKIDSKYLIEAINAFQSNPKVKLVYANTIEFGARNRKEASPSYSYEKMFTENLIPCTALFRKSDFEKTIGYNTNMRNGLEDWDFWLSFLSVDDIVVKLEGFYLHYRIKEISRSALIDKEKNENLILQIFKNHTHLFLEYFNPVRDHIEADFYKKRTKDLQNSKEYKIGSIICLPFKMIKKLYRKLVR